MAEYRTVTTDATLSDSIITANASVPDIVFNALAQLVPNGIPLEGFEYETGEWSTEEETKNGVVMFSRTHTKRPFLFVICSQPQGEAFEFMTCYHALIFSFYDLFGYGIPRRTEEVDSKTDYGFMIVWACTTYSLGMTATRYDLIKDPNASGTPTYDNIKAYLKPNRVDLPNGTNQYSTAPWDWTPNVQYKWFAVWAKQG